MRIRLSNSRPIDHARKGILFPRSFLKCLLVGASVLPVFADRNKNLPLYPESLKLHEKGILSFEDWIPFPREELTGLRMGQAWGVENPLDGGSVYLAYSNENLYVMAILPDKDIFNPVRTFNEPAYEKGDVFEIFLQAEGSSSYYEFHVTPENQRFQLTFRELREGATPGGFTPDLNTVPLSTHVRRAEEFWEAYVKIPLRELVNGEDALPLQWSVSFGRYDYTRLPNGETEVELFSSSAHKTLSFHRRQEWIPMILAPLEKNAN